MSVEHQVWKEEPQSDHCSEDEEQDHCVQEEELQDTYTEVHSLSDETSSSRTEFRHSSRTRSYTGSNESCSSPSSEEENKSNAELQPPNQSAICKKQILKRPKGQNRAGHFTRPRRVPHLPLIRLCHPDFPQQRITSAQKQRINQLSSQVMDLQHQLSSTVQENRLLRRLHSRHMVALQRFQDSEASLPQMLRQHREEVRALQELLRSARNQSSTLSRRLRGTEAELLNTCDALHRLLQLSQDQSLEEREKLTQRLTTLSTSLQKQNHRIKDLEKNLALSNASFNRQLSAEMRKTAVARELARRLEEEKSHLTQKLKMMEKELEIHNIYSLRFLKGRSKRGTIESKSVQTDAASSSPAEVPARLLEIEYLHEKRPSAEFENQLGNSWEFYASDCADYIIGEEEKEVENEGEETTDNRTTEDGSDGGTDGLTLEFNAEQEVLTAEPSQTTPSSEQPSLADQNQPSFQDLVNMPSPSTNKSSMKLKRHYTFKETILNLHCGKPAYEHGHHKAQSSPVLLDACAYKPSFLPAPPKDTRKNSLMKELLGQVHMVEQKPDVKGDFGPKNSELSRTEQASVTQTPKLTHPSEKVPHSYTE